MAPQTPTRTGAGRASRSRGAERRPARISAERAELIVDAHCTSKARYTNPGAARRAAQAARARSGEPFSSYRCSFGGGTRATAHWHVDRYPSLAALQDLADAIRYRAQQPASGETS